MKGSILPDIVRILYILKDIARLAFEFPTDGVQGGEPDGPGLVVF